jgi:ABC-type sugar transport system substrate-binding protein
VESRIGLFLPSGPDDDYHARIAREAEVEARRQHLTIDVAFAEGTAAKQANDVVHFLLENPGDRLCTLVVPIADAVTDGDVEASGMYRLGHRVLAKGAGFVILNHGRLEVVRALRERHPDLPVGLVAIDNVEFGRIQGQQLQALLPAGGTVLCVRGNPYDSASQDRSAGLAESVEGTSIRVEETDGLWRPEVAEAAVHRWLTSPTRRTAPIEAIVSQDDDMGLAAIKALASAAVALGRPDLRQVPVIGGDGLPNRGRLWVDEGTLRATVSVTLPGRPAVDLIARHWRTGTPLPAFTSITPVSYPLVAQIHAPA